jgi:hypothetical protein
VRQHRSDERYRDAQGGPQRSGPRDRRPLQPQGVEQPRPGPDAGRRRLHPPILPFRRRGAPTIRQGLGGPSVSDLLGDRPGLYGTQIRTLRSGGAPARRRPDESVPRGWDQRALAWYRVRTSEELVQAVSLLHARFHGNKPETKGICQGHLGLFHPLTWQKGTVYHATRTESPSNKEPSMQPNQASKRVRPAHRANPCACPVGAA